MSPEHFKPIRKEAALAVDALTRLLAATIAWSQDESLTQALGRQHLEEQRRASNDLSYAMQLMTRETNRRREAYLRDDRRPGDRPPVAAQVPPR